ncbi:Stage 0 sporulation protein G [Actinobacillus pleuropneumoniae]|nr:Stage 0 sporulation protein G [Actinobacillus pleuropneumoniae]
MNPGCATHWLTISMGQAWIEVVGMASNGIEALELVGRKKPDIMLIDVQMPEMDGLTLLGELRSRQDISRLTKMIILSGHDNFEFAQLALEYGGVQIFIEARRRGRHSRSGA